MNSAAKNAGLLRWKLSVDGPSVKGRRGVAPSRVSLPCPEGLVLDASEIAIVDDEKRYSVVQPDVLAWWSDRSVRWCQLDFVCELGRSYWVSLGAVADAKRDAVDVGRPAVVCQTGEKAASECLKFDSLDLPCESSLTIHLTHGGKHYLGQLAAAVDVASGSVRWTRTWAVSFVEVGQGKSPLIGQLTADSYADVPVVQFTFSVQNPQAMDHPGGNWDLGSQGAVHIDRLAVHVSTETGTDKCLIANLGDSSSPIAASKELEIYQDSSGGENWNSQNHLTAQEQLSVSFRGYRGTADGNRFEGHRAQPVLRSTGNGIVTAIAYRNFWQNFPKSLQADAQGLTIELFPGQTPGGHELQGGEQKTHEFAVEWRSADDSSSIECLTQSPVLSLEPECYASADAIPYLSNDAAHLDARYEELVALAIEGDDTFDKKSEVIDQFGWRNYGDLYGDHEAVHHRGANPLISHYNNQYDCTLGFALQFLRSGDRRWFDWMIRMADHSWDIDTYHTDDDKLLYSRGLFWHTYHYADAHTATHRSYPKRLRVSKLFDGGQDLEELGDTGEELAKNYAVGGGPAASHNYSTGWMLAYYLTGKDRYRHAAINAADYVLAIDDGNGTPFRWLCRSDTGYSTCSSEGYFGPGRAAANSTHALLTGHELTGDSRYLDRAGVLMRRTVHPRQNLDALDLLNAELRWFYTMYLQALGRLVDYKFGLGQQDDDFRYGVATLLHYADWMVQHERPTLSEPEKLQYPNETWAAQDMRKWHVLEHAALYQCDPARRDAYQQKADFFFDNVCETLTGSPTKALCRPVVLMLNFGWQRGWFKNRKGQSRIQQPILDDFGPYVEFVPQRSIAVRRFKRLVVVGAGLAVAALLVLVTYMFGVGPF
ncbi:hypothetical protein FF011L_51500 [Roseimaritima multifibrata]|uniref:Uncharacterized protein n=1 Tax=Roseimaritima multifibrata TaxID=1930274 RepID=A0A517MN83_9BACT|nr:hypothetical protein [Roseimaritima multifibrata]QDS96342.1 hypothetical protein FF011L_51500 [Roseimaritima multifibrata]